MKPQEFQASLKGAICEVFTPYKAGNIWEVDHEALKSNLRFLVAGGIKVAALTGSSGEASELDDEERMAVWKTAVEEVKGKMVLMAGNGHYALKGAMEMAKYAEKIGIDGLMPIAPYYHMFDQEGLYQYYKKLAETTGLGVLVYNSPRYAKVNILPPLMDRLAQLPNVVGLKETAYDMAQFYSMLRVMEKYNKPVVNGMGEIWHLPGSIVSAASTGFFSLTANWWPEGAVAIDAAITKKDMPAATDYFRKLAPYSSMMFRIFKARQHSSLAVAKEPMDMVEGVKGGQVRLPLTPLSDAERTELKGIVKAIGLKVKK